MLIIPIAGRFDWRHPPLATLALIALNCVIFAMTANQDEAAYTKASNIYLQENLIEFEKDLFIEHASKPEWLADRGLVAPPADEGQLAMYIITDRAFDHVVAKKNNKSGDWQEGRKRFEDAILEDDFCHARHDKRL